MAYAESKREKILRYLEETTMLKVNGSEPYNFDMAYVSRNFMFPEDLRKDRFPAVFIMDDFVSFYKEITGGTFTTGRAIHDIDEGMLVGLAGYVRVNTSGDVISTGEISTEMNKMHSDLLIAMNSDRTLGGNCLSLSIVSSHNSLEYVGSGNYGVVQHMYSIKYDFNPAASTPVT